MGMRKRTDHPLVIKKKKKKKKKKKENCLFVLKNKENKKNTENIV